MAPNLSELAPDPSPLQPARVLGPIDAGCIVVGAIIGVGIFLNPGQVARLTGSGGLALTAWAIAGGIALCGALTFAALGRRYHANGAQYEILRDAYGSFPAFIFVFCNATAIQAGAAAVIAIICVEYLFVAAGAGEATKLGVSVAGAGLILGLIGANAVGVRWGSQIQNLTVYCKLLTLLLVTALALTMSPDSVEATSSAAPVGGRTLSPLQAVLAALVPCLFAYGGWQHSLWISGEVRNPTRNLPRAIVGGVILVVAVYLLANWSYLRLLGIERVAASRALAADAVGVVWPEIGRRLVAAAVAVSAFGVLNAQLLSGPRLVYGMARDGRFFEVFAVLSPRFGTPFAAIALIGGMALVLLFAAGKGGADLLTVGTVFVDSVFFVLTGAAVFVLRRSRATSSTTMTSAGEEAGTLRTLGHPVVPALFVIGEVGLLVGAYMDPGRRAAAYLGAAWIAAAAILYLVAFRKK